MRDAGQSCLAGPSVAPAVPWLRALPSLGVWLGVRYAESRFLCIGPAFRCSLLAMAPGHFHSNSARVVMVHDHHWRWRDDAVRMLSINCLAPTNLTFIDGLSFCAGSSARIELLGVCLLNGRFGDAGFEQECTKLSGSFRLRARGGASRLSVHRQSVT